MHSRGAAIAVAVFVAIGLALAAAPRAQAQTFTTLYSFCSESDCADGQYSRAALAQGSDGNFYGTTYFGGANPGANGLGNGTVFKITPTGTLTTLYSFCSQSLCTDGANPNAGLVLGSDGNFYGTTVFGGVNQEGTVFKITPTGTLTTLYSFGSRTLWTDGYQPDAGLVEGRDGNFYGTTGLGGAYEEGAVFRITATGTLTTLYSFCSQGGGCTDGYSPIAALVQGSDGDFYGTTCSGGAYGGGTVFKITPTGTLTTLYSFCSQSGCTDGASPSAALVQASDGNFYGTTYSGGASDRGTIFQITPSGTLSTLYGFCSQSGCTDGVYPSSALVQGSDGNFYGTIGCSGYNGTIFQITPSGTFTTLYRFCSQSGCADGFGPIGGVIQASDGNFYGTTGYGGAYYGNGVFGGTVFRLLPVSPIANVSPLILTFGHQVVGTSSPPQTVTLYNTGNAPLAIPGIGTSGDFAQTNNCGGSIAAGGSCTISVTFTPTQAGSRIGTLTITDNSNAVGGSQQTVSLAGTAPYSAASLSPVSLSMGSQVISTTSTARKVTLTSHGNANLIISSIAITGANAGDFAETNTCPATLAPGAKCTISVTFTPSTLGAEGAALNVNDNGTNSPQTTRLTGTGVLPATLMPPSVGFGNVVEGTTSAGKAITLTNNQTVALTNISIGITGSNDYSQTNPCGSSIGAEQTCTITVTFTPSIIGADNATLSISDSAANSPQTAALTGTGTTPVTLTPTRATYSSQTVGTTSAAKAFTLTSNLNATLNNVAISTSGDFAVSSTTCTTTLASKGKCTVNVVFKPTAKGTRTGTLSVSDSADNSPQTSQLTGTGK
jgi:uncharacterized repeat protein (TIGR03803 family)